MTNDHQKQNSEGEQAPDCIPLLRHATSCGKVHSLIPDLVTGWKPKYLKLPAPIIITYRSLLTTQLLNYYAAQNHRIVYIGRRSNDSLSFLQNKGITSNTALANKQVSAFLRNKLVSKIKDSQLQANNQSSQKHFIGINPELPNQIQFQSDFESGNLDMVLKGQKENEYNIFLRPDTNTCGHMLWFYFKATNKPKGTTRPYRHWMDLAEPSSLNSLQSSCPSSSIIINICNAKKQSTLYSRGMRPYVRSKHLFQTYGIGWHQSGSNISYSKTNLKQQNEEKVINGITKKVEQYPEHYCLSFEYKWQNDDDEVEFAYCPPYTYTDLKRYLQRIRKQADGQFLLRVQGMELQNLREMQESKLCSSLSGLDIPLLTITDPTVPAANKVTVLSVGRIHPGESNSSYAMQGFIDYLLSDAASEARRHTIFKVIPMLNPDGVVMGNYRTSLSGKDLNRQFKTKNQDLFPEVVELKKLVKELKKQWSNALIKDTLHEQSCEKTETSEIQTNNVIPTTAPRKNQLSDLPCGKVTYFLDFHGHSIKKNVFLYGPQHDVWNPKREKAKLFPRLLSLKTDMFRYKSCLFKVAPFKKTTARAYMLNYAPYCYTIESSVGLFRDQKQNDIDFTTDKWRQMGAHIGSAIQDLVTISNDADNRRKLRVKKDKNQKRKESVTDRSNLETVTQKGGDIFILESPTRVVRNSIQPMGSCKYMSPIRHLKKKSEQTSSNYDFINLNQFPKIEEKDCESDGFSEGKSDCQSDSNDLSKQQYARLSKRIVHLKQLFEEIDFDSLTRNKQKSKHVKSKHLKKNLLKQLEVKQINVSSRPNRQLLKQINAKIVHMKKEMFLVPSLRHRMKCPNSEKRIRLGASVQKAVQSIV